MVKQSRPPRYAGPRPRRSSAGPAVPRCDPRARVRSPGRATFAYRPPRTGSPSPPPPAPAAACTAPPAVRSTVASSGVQHRERQSFHAGSPATGKPHWPHLEARLQVADRSVPKPNRLALGEQPGEVAAPALRTLMPTAPPFHPHHIHPPALRMLNPLRRHHLEPSQPERGRDKIVPLPVDPGDSSSWQEGEPRMNRSAYAVNPGERSTESREEPETT